MILEKRIKRILQASKSEFKNRYTTPHKESGDPEIRQHRQQHSPRDASR